MSRLGEREQDPRPLGPIQGPASRVGIVAVLLFAIAAPLGWIYPAKPADLKGWCLLFFVAVPLVFLGRVLLNAVLDRKRPERQRRQVAGSPWLWLGVLAAYLGLLVVGWVLFGHGVEGHFTRW